MPTLRRRGVETDDYKVDATEEPSPRTSNSVEEHDVAGLPVSAVKKARGRKPGPRLPIWDHFQQGTTKIFNNWEAICRECQSSEKTAKPMRGEKKIMETHFYSCPFIEESVKEHYRSQVSVNSTAKKPPPRRVVKQAFAHSDQEDGDVSVQSLRNITPPRKKIKYEHYSAHSTPANESAGLGEHISTSQSASTLEEERFVQYIYGVLGTVDPADKKRYIQAIKCTVAKLDLEIAGQDEL